MNSTEIKKLTRPIKIAMLEALRAGELDSDNAKTIVDFIGREPVEIRFAGSVEEMKKTIDEVPDINE